MLPSLALLAFSVIFCSAPPLIAAAFQPHDYSNSLQLDPSFWLFWTVHENSAQANASTPLPGDGISGTRPSKTETSAGASPPLDAAYIRFAIKAKTAGYVAIGLSEVGAMVGSDMMVGMVDGSSGQAIIADAFSFNRSKEGAVAVDQQQDVHVVGGEESVEGSSGETWTVLEFWRLLSTGDVNDRDILQGRYERVIWATGSLDSVEYHGPEERGGVEVILFPAKSQLEGEGEGEKAEVEGVTTYNVTAPTYIVPSAFTTYGCNVYNVSFESKVHAVEWGVIINTNVPQAIHHTVVYSCTPEEAAIAASYGPNWICSDISNPCAGVVGLWAVGGKNFILPENVGVPFGPGGHTQLVLETHYTNPGGRTDIVDQSGMFFKIAPKLRPIDAGMFITGPYSFDRLIRIPPGVPSWTLESVCPAEATRANLPGSKSIKLIASMNHQHLLGRQVYTELYRNGKLVTVINRQDYYDFNFQQMVDLSPGIDIKGGDELRTYCVFNSTGRDNVTLGGVGTKNEMCMNYMLFYPADFSKGGYSGGPCFDACLGLNETGYPVDGSNAPIQVPAAVRNYDYSNSMMLNGTCNITEKYGGFKPFEAVNGDASRVQVGVVPSQLPGIPAILPPPAAPSAPPAISSCPTTFQGSSLLYSACQDLRGGLQLLWNGTQAKSGSSNVTIHAMIRAKGAEGKYIAWGISPTGGMVGSSVVSGLPQSDQGSSISITNYYLASKSAGEIQPGTSKLLFSNTEGEMQDGTMVIKFSIDLPAHNVDAAKMIWARGSHSMVSNGMMLTQHSSSDAYSGSINFSEGEAESGSNNQQQKKVHGILNAIGWGILMPLGAFAARYFKGFDPAWFYVHVAFQAIGYGLGLSGFITGLVLWGQTDETKMGHLIIGFFIAILATFQVTALVLRPGKGSTYRGVWNVLHHNMGRIVLVLVFVNVFLGFGLIHAASIFFILYGLFLGLLLLAAVSMELFRAMAAGDDDLHDEKPGRESTKGLNNGSMV